MREGLHRLSELNSSVTWTVLALSVVGLINLYSATQLLGDVGASPAYYSQLVWMLIAWTVCLIAWRVDYHLLERMAYPLYTLSLVGLVAVLLWGEVVSGHQSWLKIGPFQVQPSEFAKIGYLFALAKYFSNHDSIESLNLKELIVPFLIVGLPLVLILIEGDLGGTLFFILTFISIILFVGVRRKTLSILVGLSISTVFLAYFFLLNSYQRSRLQTFVQPDLDPRGQGYQIIQSKIAVGSGMLTGKGFLQGVQNKLLYLPEKHTDFIFPVLAEEWGFIGSLGVMLLYLALIMAGTHIASKARDRFGLFIALGITALLFWQVVINVGGVLGLLPLTGVTLPFLSYGGSSLVTIFFGIGILLNVRASRGMFTSQGEGRVL